MTIKEKIQNDFVSAMKSRDSVVKDTLNIFKSQIVIAEKANGNQELDDTQVLKVLTASIKQRKLSIEAFESAGRIELANKEIEELAVLERYLPKQMSDSEIEISIKTLLEDLRHSSPSNQVLIGKTLGAFNKKFQGLAEPSRVKSIVESLV